MYSARAFGAPTRSKEERVGDVEHEEVERVIAAWVEEREFTVWELLHLIVAATGDVVTSSIPCLSTPEWFSGPVGPATCAEAVFV